VCATQHSGALRPVTSLVHELSHVVLHRIADIVRICHDLVVLADALY